VTTAVIATSGLCHDYSHGERKHRVLDQINLSVSRGETVVLLGASGSGKSTLLNLMGGMEPIQQGDIHLFGKSLRDMDDRRRTLLRRESLGFVHQAFNLIPTLSVADNISLPLALAGVPRAQSDQRRQQLLEDVGLAGRGGDWPDRLSGGEQQRVAIARALAAKPPLILADEPTGNLDAVNGQRVMQLLARLVEEHSASLVVVTHSLDVARIADRSFALSTSGLKPVDTAAAAAAGAW